MNDYHLSKLFSKPAEGEYVPITFIEFRRRLVGWSTELKRSMYVETEDDKEKLKRIREMNVMTAINHISGRTSSIELTDNEKFQFEEVYSNFLKKGGQLMYTRKKVGARTVSFFELREAEKRAIDIPEKSLLSDRI
ncbi:MAG: hypothetical protein Q7J35_08065 [Candidatus Methanoperedens sp.]|nr:hypothetical protein [Candidatus Methanoperedens sp.]